MAENDIYNSKSRYEKVMTNLEDLALTPNIRYKHNYKRKYYCKNPKNLKWFRRLTKTFDVKDTSYIRRLRLFRTLIIVVYVTKKELSRCSREEID